MSRDSARQFWDTMMASAGDAPAPVATAPAAPTPSFLGIGSVGGNVIIMGNIQPGALEAVLARRKPKTAE